MLKIVVLVFRYAIIYSMKRGNNAATEIKKMTIANQILAFYTSTTESGDDVNIPDLMDECEEKAVNKDHDWDAESTTYEFADGSVIVVCNNEARHYGCKE